MPPRPAPGRGVVRQVFTFSALCRALAQDLGGDLPWLADAALSAFGADPVQRAAITLRLAVLGVNEVLPRDSWECWRLKDLYGFYLRSVLTVGPPTLAQKRRGLRYGFNSS